MQSNPGATLKQSIQSNPYVKSTTRYNPNHLANLKPSLADNLHETLNSKMIH